MNAETFCEQFATFAEAPNGVAALRELILQLAVQGKLTKSITTDEPASVLRAEMESARQRMTDKGEIRSGDEFTPVGVDEAPYALPKKWEWVRVGEVMHLINGKAFKPTDWLTAGLPIVRIQNLNNPDAPFNYTGDDVEERVRLKDDDFLISWSGTPGTSFGAFIWNRGPAALNQHIFRAILFGNAFSKPFLRIAVNARLDEMIAQAHGGVGLQHITKGKLERLSLPLPPLAEQKRIVAKVDQLLGLCDELAAAQAARRETRERLVGATLDRLISTRSPAEFPTHANRLRVNFDRLFDTPTTVPQLRQAVLRLAVEGKLATQDRRDTPARELIDQISRQKLIKIQAKEIRQGKVSRPTTAHDAPDELPFGWEWVNVDILCFKVTDGTHFTPTYVDSGVRFVSAKDIVNGKLTFDRCKFITLEEHQQLYRRCNPQYQDIVITKSGSIGAVALVEDKNEFSLFESLALLKFDQSALFPQFLVYALTHACACLTAGHIKGVAVKHLHLDILRGLEIPLPPLAEQKRIVSKLTELLSLCDALEAKLTQAESASGDLLASVVSQFVSAC